MVQRKDLLTFQFYQKEKFTGSDCGMRYLIRREQIEEREVFAVFTWPGPYGFDAAGEEQKEKKIFPFEEKSLDEIASYLNSLSRRVFTFLQ